MSATRAALLGVVAATLLSTAIITNGQSNVPARIVSANTLIAPADLPQGAKDVVKLFGMGKKDSVLVFYVSYSGLDFHLNAQHVIYLKSVGVSSQVINAMIETDKEHQKALAVRSDDDRYYAPTVSSGLKAEPAENVAPPEQSELPAVRAVIYPDYSAFPSYYQTFDNSDHNHVSVVIGIGVGATLGFGDGFHHGYYGHGHYHR